MNRIICACRNAYRINSTPLGWPWSLIATLFSSKYCFCGDVHLSLVGNQMSCVIKVLGIVSRNMNDSFDMRQLTLPDFHEISRATIQSTVQYIAISTSIQIMSLVSFTLFDDRIESFRSRRKILKVKPFVMNVGRKITRIAIGRHKWKSPHSLNPNNYIVIK